MSLADPMGPFDFVALNAVLDDPAIDRTDEDQFAEYRKRYDPALAPVKPGQTPVTFVGQALPPVLVMSAYASMPFSVRAMLVFQAACHEIRMPDGVVRRPKKTKPGAHGTRIADDAWVNDCSLAFGVDTIEEIGDAIYRLSRLPESARGPLGSRAGSAATP